MLFNIIITVMTDSSMPHYKRDLSPFDAAMLTTINNNFLTKHLKLTLQKLIPKFMKESLTKQL